MFKSDQPNFEVDLCFFLNSHCVYSDMNISKRGFLLRTDYVNWNKNEVWPLSIVIKLAGIYILFEPCAFWKQKVMETISLGVLWCQSAWKMIFMSTWIAIKFIEKGALICANIQFMLQNPQLSGSNLHCQSYSNQRCFDLVCKSLSLWTISPHIYQIPWLPSSGGIFIQSGLICQGFFKIAKFLVMCKRPHRPAPDPPIDVNNWKFWSPIHGHIRLEKCALVLI